MRTIARLEDTLIAVEVEGDGQRILLQATPQGWRLAQFLAGRDEPERRDGFFVVPHDTEVDARLVILVDALIALRWAHPTYTQLELSLSGRGGR